VVVKNPQFVKQVFSAGPCFFGGAMFFRIRAVGYGVIFSGTRKNGQSPEPRIALSTPYLNAAGI